MREAELDDIKKEVSGLNEQVSAFNPLGTIHDELKGAIEVGARSERCRRGAGWRRRGAGCPAPPSRRRLLPPRRSPASRPSTSPCRRRAAPALSGPLPEPVDADRRAQGLSRPRAPRHDDA